MKYLRATFKNYIGFFNGMGLYKFDVDFSKCNNSIITIQGGNGRGKSTLLNHLNPFPDSSNSFIPDKTAEKILVLFHEGDLYNINIISPADLKGRKTTKAYIQKNGIELNENGNVSSYKDIIFSEFELDSNYISLSRLSSTDRGLGDKTPAERKKFTANIIENLEIYNNMYKSLNKKSLVYKSHINTLHTKIQNIGDKATLDQRLSSLQNKESELNTRIMQLNNMIVSIQAKNSIDDEEAREIQEATELADKLLSELNIIEVQMNTLHNKTKIHKDSIIVKYNDDNALLNSYTSKASELNSIYLEKNNRLSDVSNNILSIKADLSSSDTDDSIADRYNDSIHYLDTLKEELLKTGVDNNLDLIIPLTNVIVFFDRLVYLLDKFNDNMTSSDIDFLINTYSKSYIDLLLKTQSSIIEQIESYKNEISDIQGQMKVLGTLENRPGNCKIDTCAFISEALKLKKNLKVDLIEQLSTLQESILSLSDSLTEIEDKFCYASSMAGKKTELDIIRASVLENESILSIFYPDFISTFDAKLISLYSFSEVRDHSNLTDALNILKIIKEETTNNKILETEYKGYREKIKLLNSSRAMLEKLESEQIILVDDIRSIKSELDEYNKTINDISNRISIEKEYSNIVTKYNDKFSEYQLAKSKVDEYKKKSSKALDALSNIASYRSEIESLSRELNPVMKDINTISGQLTLLDSYYMEYNEYKSSYDIIETIKKYCSPTGGGIQTLFMQIYMSKTKQTANEVLAMLFNGSYQLLDFVINENEFRIPFIGEGLPVDDISSGSGAQISMMSMIINLVLLHQASTKFNIAQLDELDGQLDSYNRSQFINVLFYSMKVLEIDQLFIISHSLEADNTFADIINLGGLEEYSGTSSGNIIWDFNIDGKTE